MLDKERRKVKSETLADSVLTSQETAHADQNAGVKEPSPGVKHNVLPDSKRRVLPSWLKDRQDVLAFISKVDHPDSIQITFPGGASMVLPVKEAVRRHGLSEDALKNIMVSRPGETIDASDLDFVDVVYPEDPDIGYVPEENQYLRGNDGMNSVKMIDPQEHSLTITKAEWIGALNKHGQ